MIFLGGDALVSCSTSTPINHIVFFFCRIPVVLENRRSSQGGAHPLHPPPRSAPEQRRQRLRKRHSKSEVGALLQNLSRLFYLVQLVKCSQFFVEFNSKRLYRSSGKERGSPGLAFTFSTKRENRHFHVVIVQWRQRNVQESVMHVQSCCFANINRSLFWRSCWRRRRCC